ncbi:hypothetical protein MM239_09795 [Belliella sp. DSM 111904]|uniref:Agl cluster protein AglQ n=1 Tax=Belliella filtrata TaxID=2923435 RepID=A0ABS9UZU7_9BACT|nr:hypothetical protein [Belliella filtrata]MCH7409686.1 hypothetical protein [Belliella filtrata]
MEIRLNDLLLKASTRILKMQNIDGSFPSGHNGPYNDPETPVRNTAHVLFFLSDLYSKTNDDTFKKSALKCMEYLKSDKSRPFFKTFYHRDKIGKDSCNGLVGQAWCIEALVKASICFDDEESYSLAQEVFFLHKFDDRIGLWNRTEINGDILGFDGTFNHQLWFAASAGMLSRTPAALEAVDIFLDKIVSKVKLYGDNIIYHESSMGDLYKYLNLGLRSFLGQVKSRAKNAVPSYKSGLYSKSVGYHAFNVYALAMLKVSRPKHELWESNLIQKILTVTESDNFRSTLKNSKYGYFYNTSGIELAFGFESLLENTTVANNWLNLQFENTFLNIEEPLSNNSPDRNTSIARIYAASRLKENYLIKI